MLLHHALWWLALGAAYVLRCGARHWSYRQPTGPGFTLVDNSEDAATIPVKLRVTLTAPVAYPGSVAEPILVRSVDHYGTNAWSAGLHLETVVTHTNLTGAMLQGTTAAFDDEQQRARVATLQITAPPEAVVPLLWSLTPNDIHALPVDGMLTLSKCSNGEGPAPGGAGCVQCGAGTVSANGAGVCVPCEAGTFMEESGSMPVSHLQRVGLI